MKIFIKDIKPEGLDVEYDIGVEETGLSDKDHLYFIKPLHVRARVELVENTVLCKTKVNSRYQSICSRTLVDVRRDYTDEFLLDFSIDRNTEFIDITDDIRQEVILGLPMKILCDEEIKKDKEQESLPVEKGLAYPAQEEQKTYQPFADLELKKE